MIRLCKTTNESAEVCDECGAYLRPSTRQNCPSRVTKKPATASIRLHSAAQRGLGTLLANWFSWCGYTKGRHNAIRRWLGITTPCGCAKREELLNRIGRYFGIG